MSNGTRTLERTNPFDQEQEPVDNACSDICALYNASVGTANEAPLIQDFGDSVQDDFFDEPLINVDSTSAVDELEDAILRCKHMVLATSNEDEARRQRLLDRLIELRCILHNIKENTTNTINDSFTLHNSVNYSSTPDGRDHTTDGSPSPATSTRSLAISEAHLSSIRGDSNFVPGPGGHEFRLVLPLRQLGALCERCLNPIRNPSKRVLYCNACHIVCHSHECLRGLTRRCPAVVSSTNELRLSPTPISSRRNRRRTSLRRSIAEQASVRRTRSFCETEAAEPLKLVEDAKSAPFRCLEVTKLTYIGANLSAQCWACHECQQPLRPAPNRTVVPERSVMTSLVQRAGNVLESGIGLLTRQATEPGTENLTWHTQTPQICSQDPTLSDYSAHLLGSKAVISTPAPSVAEGLRWAYSSTLHDLGPLQTWEDARVHEAINRINRMPLCSARIFRGDARVQQTLNNRTNLQSESVARSANATDFDQARLCYYTGKFYCSRCHWGDSHLIPACVFVLGDYRPKPVCRSSLLWLNYSWSRHLFRVPDAWYKYEPRARKFCSMRLRAFRLRPYLDVCDTMREIQGTAGLSNPSWILEQPYTFNMAVVNHVLDGTIVGRMQSFLSSVDEHIQSCHICSSRVPDRCSVCNEGPIRTYQPKSAFCYSCRQVCHRSCLLKPLPLYVEHAATLSESDQQDWVEVTYPVIRALCRKCG